MTGLRESLMSVLECPVCMEYMVPPITLCVNGHNICNMCRPKLDDCPNCRKRFLSTRNVALEKLAREMQYPCTYRQFGCMELLALDMLDGHKVNCRYGQLTCPVNKRNKSTYCSWSMISYNACEWTGNYKEVKNHLMEKHLEMCFDYGEVELRPFINSGSPAWRRKFVFFDNEVFYRSFFWEDGIFYVALQYIGSHENAAKYKYKVKFVNTDNTEGITVMHLTRSFIEDVDDIFKSGNCGKLQYDVVSRLATKEGELKFKLEIFRVGD